MKGELEQLLLSTRFSLRREVLFGLMSFTIIPVTLFILTWPPVIVSQGQAHRIFYLHVPIAWVALYAPLLSALTGLLFLYKRKEVYDIWSLSAARLAFLFGLGVVISGPLWAQTEWGVYWNWKDARLISFFVLLLVLGAYFLLRSSTEQPHRQATLGAGISLLAALSAVLTWLAIRWIEPDTHPQPVLASMSPKIGLAFWISVAAYHLLFIVLLRLAIRQEFLHRLELAARADLV